MAVISTDPVADMLTRIRNAILVRQHEVSMPHSKLKEGIAVILKKKALVIDYKVDKDGFGHKQLKITINQPQSNARISEIKRISTPGRRVYTRADKMPVIKNGRGMIIVSTSQGLMTGAEAKAKGVGGEVICSIY